MGQMGFWVHARVVNGDSVGNMFLAFRSPSAYSLYVAPFETFRNFFGVPLRGGNDNVCCWSKHRFEIDDRIAAASFGDPRLRVWFKVLGRNVVDLKFDPRTEQGSQYGRVWTSVPVFNYKPRPGYSNYFDYFGRLTRAYRIDSDGGRSWEEWLGQDLGYAWLHALVGRNNLSTHDDIDTLVRNTLFEEW